MHDDEQYEIIVELAQEYCESFLKRTIKKGPFRWSFGMETER